MLKSVMFENEMEDYLVQNSYNISDGNGCLDSGVVFDYAIHELGYEPYRLDNDTSMLHDTYIFIK